MSSATGAGAAPAAPGRPAPPRVALERRRGLVAEMADGTELVADCWRPAGAGPLPVLLQRLPYGRTVASAPVLPSPARLARLGYAVVVQDVRGTGDSGGWFAPFRHEADDGAASVEWAAGQDFCNGDVVTYGFSYQGLDQIQAAALEPAGLRGIAPMMCGATPYELVYEDGCLMLEHAVRWAAQLASIAERRPPRPVELGALPVAGALGDDPPGFFESWVRHRDPGADFWAGVAPDLARVRVPCFVVLGYADTFAKATARLAGALGAEVVAGPWAHLPWGTRFGDLELGPEAGPGRAHVAFEAFLDRVLGPGTPGPSPGTTFFVVGEGWRSAPCWPPAGASERLHASSTIDASSRHGDGRLVADAPDGELGDLLVAEPLAPHPGTSAPFADLAADEDRRDVLCYTSEPLEDDWVVAGSPEVAVELVSDAASLDVVAALVLVEGGRARRLATGGRRIELPAPGAPVAVRVELGPVAWRLPRGARLRLELAASCFPRYARNPQSAGGTGPGDHAVATIEIASAALDLVLA